MRYPGKALESAVEKISGVLGNSPPLAEFAARLQERKAKAGPQLLQEAKEQNYDLAGIIDHTLLRPEATRQQIANLCGEALRYGFHSVCVNPVHVETCRRLLDGSTVKVCSVVGFPLGASFTAAKAFEASWLESVGAQEIDMVLNVGALKDDEISFVRDDIAAVVQAVASDIVVKVIIESCYLDLEQKVKACLLARIAGADFVKTSTGFGAGGAVVEDVALMRFVVGGSFGVKAAGGIRDKEAAKSMVRAGANRLGSSASLKIVAGEAG